MTNNTSDINVPKVFRFVDGMEVDVLFDVDQRELKICVVGACEPQKEAKIWKFSLHSKFSEDNQKSIRSCALVENT